MDDLISRAAALEALGECPYNWNDWLEEIQAVDDWESHKEAIENIPAVDAVPVVQQWISVKDRLPVNLGTVIVANKAGVSFAYFNGAYWERGAATKHKPIKTITHWMPLPEPPKMDGDANG